MSEEGWSLAERPDEVLRAAVREELLSLGASNWGINFAIWHPKSMDLCLDHLMPVFLGALERMNETQ